MKIDKEKLRKMASLPDDELWQTVHSIAQSNGISLPEKTPSKEELNKLRAIIADPDKINMFTAMKLINDYKRGNK